MKCSLLLVCGLILPVITGCGSSLATENVGTGTAAIELDSAGILLCRWGNPFPRCDRTSHIGTG
jgi:hypothetical protein